MLAQGEQYAMPPIPTSDPRDSDRVFERPAQPGPPALYDAYTATRAVSIGVTIQPATITRAPLRRYDNPEFHDPGQGPFQDAWRQVALGAPPIPRSTPEYIYYQKQVRTPAGDYREIIESAAPRPSDGSGYRL